MRRLIPGPPPPPATRPSTGATLRALARELRPRQWIKNLACLAGLVFSGRLLWPLADLRAAIGFASFCLASSSVYILNDIVDRDKDRRNPRTARRPIASGELSVGLAVAALVALMVAANALSWGLGAPCVVALDAYFALNVLYSARLKRAVIADVMCIAFGFVLRVLHGVYAVGATPTPWIVLCMFFLALFLGFAKRRGELAGLTGAGAGPDGEAGPDQLARPVLRKYGGPYLDALLTVTATLAILCYAMSTVTAGRNPTLVVTVVPVVYCVFRYLLQVMVHAGGEAPDAVLVADRRLLAGIASWVALYVAVAYLEIDLF